MEKWSNGLHAVGFYHRAMARKRTMCSGPEGVNSGRLGDAIFQTKQNSIEQEDEMMER